MKNEFGNTNSKEIWSNHLLCAQFLRHYSGVPLLEHVQPEDITDETEKLRPFLGVEFEGDAVKKVRIQLSTQEQPSEEMPIYVVALLEHKSKVDYDVTFQLLKCMVGVWTLYRNEQDKEHPKISGTKGFRYPLVIPIVYYEGSQDWTADMHWKDRVGLSRMFGEYVPDFTYRVMNLHTYSPEELLSREEELSLVMMFNRVQTAEDLDIRKWPKGQREMAQKILQKAPEAVLKLITQMVHHFGLKLHVSEDELEQCVKNVEERDMGELWANMEKMDIQAERRNTAEARAQLAAAQEALVEKERTLTKKDQALAEKEQTIEILMAELDRLKGYSPEELSLKLHVPEAELEKCIKNVEERDMGELWADMEKMDIQAERRNTAEARAQLAAAQEALAEKDQTIAELQAELDRLRHNAE